MTTSFFLGAAFFAAGFLAAAFFAGAFGLRLGASAASTFFSLGFFLGQLGRRELLPVKRDLGDAHGGESLPMSAQLLVLLLALVVEDQNLRAATLLHDFAGHERIRTGLANLPAARRNRQHVVEFDLAVGAAP